MANEPGTHDDVYDVRRPVEQRRRETREAGALGFTPKRNGWGDSNFEPPIVQAYEAPDGVLFANRDVCKAYVEGRGRVYSGKGVDSWMPKDVFRSIRMVRRVGLDEYRRMREELAAHVHDLGMTLSEEIQDGGRDGGVLKVNVGWLGLGDLFWWYPATGLYKVKSFPRPSKAIKPLHEALKHGIISPGDELKEGSSSTFKEVATAVAAIVREHYQGPSKKKLAAVAANRRT